MSKAVKVSELVSIEQIPNADTRLKVLWHKMSILLNDIAPLLTARGFEFTEGEHFTEYADIDQKLPKTCEFGGFRKMSKRLDLGLFFKLSYCEKYPQKLVLSANVILRIKTSDFGFECFIHSVVVDFFDYEEQSLLDVFEYSLKTLSELYANYIIDTFGEIMDRGDLQEKCLFALESNSII